MISTPPLFSEALPSTETLGAEEVAALTGRKRPKDQVKWLETNGWPYATTAAGHPVVGRLYARMRLAGISPAKTKQAQGWSLDVSKVS